MNKGEVVTNEAPKVGDVLLAINQFAVARKIRVLAVSDEKFSAEVLEGDDKVHALIVYRAGWNLYAKPAQ